MAWWTHRTKTGRVVYERPKHLFKWRDTVRITDPLQVPPIDDIEFRWFLGLLLEALEKGLEAPETPKSELAAARDAVLGLFSRWETEFEQFSGGQFGGGGASRAFSRRPVNASPFDLGPCGVPWILQPFQNC